MEYIKCYCDASFDPASHMAVVGYRFENSPICYKIIENTKNTRAEMICLLDLVDELDADKNYIIYTDCLNIIHILESRDKLIQKNFNNKKGIELENSDLYKRLLEINLEHIEIKHIEGHIAKRLMNDDNKQFSVLDKFLRRELRSIVCPK